MFASTGGKVEFDTVELALLSSFNLQAFDSIQESISASILDLAWWGLDFSAWAERKMKLVYYVFKY